MNRIITYTIALLIFLFIGTSILSVSDLFPDELIDSKWYMSVGSGLLMLLFFFGLGMIKPKQLKWDVIDKSFVYAVLTACFIESVYILLQEIGAVAKIGLFTTGNFDNAAGAVSALCLGLPLGMCIKKRQNKYLLSVLIPMQIICIVAVIFSGSRTGLICLCVLGVMCMPKNKTSWQIITLTILVFITFLFCVLLKQDSTKGRFFIAERTAEMINEKPVFGWGHGGFTENYMNYQATYFSEHTDDACKMLADNIRHPLNEFLLICVDYGLLGLTVLIVIIACFVYYVYTRKLQHWKLLLTEVIMLFIWSLFSYPFSYPFTWIVVIYILSSSSVIHGKWMERRWVAVVGIIVSCVLLVTYTRAIYFTMQCRTLQDDIAVGKYGKALRGFEKIYPYKSDEYRFLYSYAFALAQAGKYVKAQKLIGECERYVADYDVQLLKGDIMAKLGCYDSAENAYENAHYMCPSRLTPLYELCHLYIIAGMREKALSKRQELLMMPIKVNSEKACRIKQEIEILKIN